MEGQKRYERYQRQIILKEFGAEGQEKLTNAKVLVVGAGGLGCPALQYMAAAGLGTIGIIDDDVVSLTNLHRQVLYSMGDIGFSKAESARKKLIAINDQIVINAYYERLVNANALKIISEYDLVIDGTDNFSTRYMINDACVLLNKPLVYGAVSKFEGQVAVFNVADDGLKEATNYRDLFPSPPDEDQVFNCAEEGVLGVLPGIIGMMQATEAIKLITGIGQPLINRILTYNALDNSIYELNLAVNHEARRSIPREQDIFLKTDYEWFCSAKSTHHLEIEAAEFDKLINNHRTLIIDVRERGELPVITEFEHVRIPLDQFLSKDNLTEANEIVLFCQSGKRSLQAAKFSYNAFKESKSIYSLKGGIVNWKNRQSPKD